MALVPAAVGGLGMALGAISLLAHALGFAAAGTGMFAPLTGVTVPNRPVAGLHSLLSGEFEAAVARAAGPFSPLFPAAVRLRNQFAFSVFGVSADPALVVGPRGQLVQTDYITEYCSRDLAAFAPFARAWAGAVRAMQDAVEQRGGTFLAVVTPSKPAQYPDVIPPNWPCPAPAADRLGLVPAWMRQLREAGVHAVDATAVLWAAHGQYPFRLYPPGGIHWNAVGAALAAAAVAAGLEAQRGDGAFTPLPFTWRVADHPGVTDRDLAELMNLVVTPAEPPSPTVEYGAVPSPAACPAMTVAIAGGSFANALANHLSREPCHPAVHLYEYWGVDEVDWQDGAAAVHAIDAAQRDRDFDGAAVVIYEANEQVLAGTYTGGPLYAHLVGHSFAGPPH